MIENLINIEINSTFGSYNVIFSVSKHIAMERETEIR